MLIRCALIKGYKLNKRGLHLAGAAVLGWPKLSSSSSSSSSVSSSSGAKSKCSTNAGDTSSAAKASSAKRSFSFESFSLESRGSSSGENLWPASTSSVLGILSDSAVDGFVVEEFPLEKGVPILGRGFPWVWGFEILGNGGYFEMCIGDDGCGVVKEGKEEEGER